MTELEKMRQGLWYNANFDEELLKQRLIAENLCFDLNRLRPHNKVKRNTILKKLIPNLEENCVILSPFMVDYGCYCHIGHDTFINHNAYLMDSGGITIGHHCFIGPNCGIYTAIHPTLAEERNQGYEQALPIVIGNNCWIGADVTILPGVKIGEGTVIGAKSVITKDIPPNVIAVGNPCRVIRSITEKESIYRDKKKMKEK